MKKHHSVSQIVYALRQVESGTAIGDLCRSMGICEQTYYKWKRKYEGMGVTELTRIKTLEEENKQLKKLVADLSLDKQMLQDVLSKKV